MNTVTQQFLKLLCAILLITPLFSTAQIGVGTTTPEGALDVTSTNGGLVPPRVLINDINDATTVVNPNGGGAPVAGTFIWNTGPNGVSPNNVDAGLYYWDGSRWVAFAGSPGGFDWALKGNSGTNNGTDFLGTTDPEPLVVKVNSIERMRMGTTETVVNEDAQSYDFRVEGTGETEMFFVDASTNHVHVRAASPFPTIDMFTSVGVDDDYPINGYATGDGNAGIYGRHDDIASLTDMNAGGAFDGSGNGFTTQAGWNVGIASTGIDAGVLGTSTSPFVADNTRDRQGGYFSNSTLSGATTTVEATASLAGYDSTNNIYYGGYFDGGQDGNGGFISNSAGDINGDGNTTDYAWVGVRYSGTNYKIMGGGSVSTVVNSVDINGDENRGRIMFAPESPEITFTDSGSGKLINGQAKITIDPILAKNIHVSENSPLRVFIQLEGDCKGTYVTDKSANGFTVKELQEGKSNVAFSWQLIAVRADSKDKEGNIRSKHVDVRFPLAPKRIVKERKMKLSKTSKNRKTTR